MGGPRFFSMDLFAPRSEWSAPPIRLEDFLMSPAWQSLPFDIKVAFAHLWMAERRSPEASTSQSLWTTAKVAAKTAEIQAPVTTQNPATTNPLPEHMPGAGSRNAGSGWRLTGGGR
jgi:hypothetical protein